jgi:caffeoyl-CoA O-methyltransferase
MTPKSQFLPPELQEYIISHSVPLDDVQRDLIAETAALGSVASMQISPEQGAFLTVLTGALGVRYAVEVGTFTGYSSIAIARGMPNEGRLLCCDVSDEWTSTARKYWDRAGLADRIELRLGPAADTLKALPAEPHIDLAFLDADKTGYIGYWEDLVPRMRPRGVILADNVFANGAVLEQNPEGESARAIKAFNDHVLADERVEVALLAIADGLTFARRR